MTTVIQRKEMEGTNLEIQKSLSKSIIECLKRRQDKAGQIFRQLLEKMDDGKGNFENSIKIVENFSASSSPFTKMKIMHQHLRQLHVQADERMESQKQNEIINTEEVGVKNELNCISKLYSQRNTKNFESTEINDDQDNPIVCVLQGHILLTRNKQYFILPPQEIDGRIFKGRIFNLNLGDLSEDSYFKGVFPHNENGDYGVFSYSLISDAFFHRSQTQTKICRLSTMSEINVLEQLLDDKRSYGKEQRMILARRLAQVGGLNLHHHVYRALSYLMKEELADKFSWTGTTMGKRSFKQMILCKLFVESIGAACKMNMKDVTSHNQIESFIKSWLKSKEIRNRISSDFSYFDENENYVPQAKIPRIENVME